MRGADFCPYVLNMSSALHIAPLSSPVGDVWVSMSSFSQGGATPSIVMWSPIQQLVVEVEEAEPETRKPLVSGPGISEPSIIDPDMASLSLLSRIWLWLRQMWAFGFCGAAEDVFCLQGEEPLRDGRRYRPNRHARKMRARRARGICPPSRYARYGQGGPLRAGYSAAELRGWARGRYPRSWFHWNHYKYYIKGFFRLMALRLSRSCAAQALCGDTCHAPLTLN